MARRSEEEESSGNIPMKTTRRYLVVENSCNKAAQMTSERKESINFIKGSPNSHFQHFEEEECWAVCSEEEPQGPEILVLVPQEKRELLV